MVKTMELIILGSGTCVPSIRRAGPSILLRAMGRSILIDSASGTLRQLARLGIKYSKIDIIFYTHLHPDHVGEFVPFVFAQKYAPGYKRELPVKVIAAKGFLKFYEGLKQAFGAWVEPREGALEIHELDIDGNSSDIISPLILKYTKARHTPQSLAYRIELPTGKSVVFTGDTDFSPEIIELAKGADLLVSECAAPEEHKVEGHLIPSEAGEMAQQAGVRQLLLTHFYPPCDKSDILGPAKKHFPGPIILAQDFLRVLI